MMKSLSILGCTGSIGRQSIAAAEHLGISVVALTANRKIDMVEEQARKLKPKFIGIYDEEAAKKAEEEAEELRRAQEIFERLEREAAADKEKELEEQRMAYAMANGDLDDSFYNETTGSYSGAYGMKPMDDDTKAQLDAIMSNNGNDISALFAQAEENAAMAEGNVDALLADTDDLPLGDIPEDFDPEAAMAEQALFEENSEE